MPRIVSEVPSGAQFTRSSEEGRLADSQTRVFKVVLNEPGEYLNIQEACGIYIGNPHPVNTNIYCQSFSASYDGDSRMVLVCRFEYATTPDSSSSSGGQDPKSQAPDVRPANWSTSTSLLEVPVQTWAAVASNGQAGVVRAAANPVGDMYDGVSRYESIVTITIEQHEPTDPTRHTLLAGSVNNRPFRIGSLSCRIGSVLFRGVQSKPTVESWGDRIWRGWIATYEFAYRRNNVKGFGASGDRDEDIGWDIAVPQTGFNVIAFDPAAPPADADVYGQPLAHDDGKIPDDPKLPNKVAAGDRVRAMVKVFSYENKGTSQLPSAQPIPLNDDGTPRSPDADPKVLVKRYRTLPEVDFSTFNLRLF